MAIPEKQLETWSHQGSVIQSKNTYATIKGSLEATDTKYASRNYAVFLQGSYGNDTNIYAESDVDIVIRLNSTFHYKLNDLTAQDKANFAAAFPSPASYLFNDFKKDAVEVLQNSFGAAAVQPGNKAIKIIANGASRSADVIVTSLFRRTAASLNSEILSALRASLFLPRTALKSSTIRSSIRRTVQPNTKQLMDGSSRWSVF